MAKILSGGGEKITSGKTYAVILIGELPPGISDDAASQWLTMQVSQSCALAQTARGVVVRLETIDPAKFAEMLNGVKASGLAKV